MIYTNCPICGRELWRATEYPRPLCASCRSNSVNSALDMPELEDFTQFENRAEGCEREDYNGSTLYTAKDGTWFEEHATEIGALVITVSEDPMHPHIYWGDNLQVYRIDVESPSGYMDTRMVDLLGSRQQIEQAALEWLTDRGYQGAEVIGWGMRGSLTLGVNDPALCEDCGCIVSWGDTESTLCGECEDRRQEELVHEYSYKPDPIFHGSDTRLFLGVELEVDRGDDRLALAERVLHDIGEDKIYCKKDGSLGPEGVEIVTHPCTLDYHMTQLDWRQICATAREYDYTSHNAGTCGLHVHASREALGDRYGARELTVAKLILMVDRLEEPLTTFSRRDVSSLERWAKIAKTGVSPDDTDSQVLDKIQGAMSYDRYVAVNTQPDETVEFRIFRGTLRFETILASIQLVDLLCHWAMTHTLNEVRAVTWQTLCEGIDRKGHLYSYCTQKGLL